MTKLTFEQREQRLVKALREHYRREYRNGESEEAFLLWLRRKLDEYYPWPDKGDGVEQ
jgi:hypothetical protein